MRIRGFCVALAAFAALLPPAPARAHERAEVRARYAAVAGWDGEAPHAAAPSARAPYAAGALRAATLEDALEYLNFLRWLSGLEPVALDARLTDIAQYGAVLQAANDFVSHAPARPSDMGEEFFQKARYAAESSNLARLNWTGGDVLRAGLEHFARDDGAENLASLGHRRWLLNPRMASTGFGLAASGSGYSYIAMYAHDMQANPGDWDCVAWPSAGAFPAELMSSELAWSLVLNPDHYDATDARVILTNLGTGEQYAFPGEGGFFAIDRGAYGAGPCLIFRPRVSEDYRQNQRWKVEVEGLGISYQVEMISLYPVDAASVEVEPREVKLRVGERRSLSAAVIPDWADDLSIAWASSDESVARVENGEVVAAAKGVCEIYATAVNGRRDVCAVEVY